MYNIRVLAASLVALLFVAGCSSSAKVLSENVGSEPIRPDSIVALAVDSPTDSESLRAADEFRSRLDFALVTQRIFEQVVKPEMSADYELSVRLADVDRVSEGARIVFGAFAGANELTASVALKDVASDRVIRSFAVRGESATHPLSSENDMHDAIRELTSKIVEILRSG